MKKQLFIDSIKIIEKQLKLDHQLADYAAKLFPAAEKHNLHPQNHLLHNQIIIILQELMGDVYNDDVSNSWIDYYINELDFGRKFIPGMVKYENENIQLSSAEDLYNFLIRLKK